MTTIPVLVFFNIVAQNYFQKRQEFIKIVRSAPEYSAPVIAEPQVVKIELHDEDRQMLYVQTRYYHMIIQPGDIISIEKLKHSWLIQLKDEDVVILNTYSNQKHAYQQAKKRITLRSFNKERKKDISIETSSTILSPDSVLEADISTTSTIFNSTGYSSVYEYYIDSLSRTVIGGRQ